MYGAALMNNPGNLKDNTCDCSERKVCGSCSLRVTILLLQTEQVFGALE